jgi:hypothetical protein
MRGRQVYSARPLILLVGNMAALALLAAGCGKPATTGTAKPGPSPTTRLPDIVVFLDRPSDRFPVDIDDLAGGHPLWGSTRTIPTPVHTPTSTILATGGPRVIRIPGTG